MLLINWGRRNYVQRIWRLSRLEIYSTTTLKLYLIICCNIQNIRETITSVEFFDLKSLNVKILQIIWSPFAPVLLDWTSSWGHISSRYARWSAIRSKRSRIASCRDRCFAFISWSEGTRFALSCKRLTKKHAFHANKTGGGDPQALNIDSWKIFSLSPCRHDVPFPNWAKI